ncbi:MAG: exo-alpha-sialidase [Boseongicola sp. SB0677_bin_26]|nr:exo-alpha-sialidase [Boseongicola sp. SB0665_bin_10]MYG25099.1 exo-alpha-sialidase [Boseongicola sp. SB0677_bin_26]
MTVSLLVGTTKGLFLVTSEDRSVWSVDGPHCNLWPINHAIGDPGTGVIWAGGGGDWEGAGVWRSEDRGASWTLSNLAHGQGEAFFAENEEVAKLFDWTPSPPAPFTGEITALWSLGRVGDRLYAGSKPAMLLASDDGGETWEKVNSLSEHPSAAEWQPGAAGLVLHTIVADPGNPEKFWLGISAAGVFATEDGGATWDRRNRLSNAEACGHHDHPAAPRDGQTGHCVHNMVRADGTGDLLYQQNHHGVYRSRDGGRSWDDITEGLPSTFGFPVHVHPRDGATIWTLPLNGDGIGRYPPDAAAAVWKSTDGGESWEAKRAGLPQDGCYFTVLRQAMSGDGADPAGIYFGTNSGSVFASTDEGETWDEVARHLPTILCVEALET